MSTQHSSSTPSTELPLPSSRNKCAEPLPLQPATPQPASAAASAGIPPSTQLAGPSGGYFSSAFGCMHECFLVGPGEQRDVVFPSHLYFTNLSFHYAWYFASRDCSARVATAVVLCGFAGQLGWLPGLPAAVCMLCCYAILLVGTVRPTYVLCCYVCFTGHSQGCPVCVVLHALLLLALLLSYFSQSGVACLV